MARRREARNKESFFVFTGSFSIGHLRGPWFTDHVKFKISESDQPHNVCTQPHQQRHRDAPEHGDDNREHRRYDRERAVDTPIPRSRSASISIQRFLYAERERHAHEKAGGKQKKCRDPDSQGRGGSRKAVSYGRTEKNEYRKQNRQQPNPVAHS